MNEKNLIVAVATYADVEDAKIDWEAVKAVHKDGALGHVACGIVEKRPDGVLDIVSHDTTATHLAWAGLAVGGALSVIFPPLGLAGLGPFLAVAGSGGLIGGVIGHFWKAVPRSDLKKLAKLLRKGESALVIVAVNKAQDRIDETMVRAVKKAVKKYDKGEVGAAYDALTAGLEQAGEIAEDADISVRLAQGYARAVHEARAEDAAASLDESEASDTPAGIAEAPPEVEARPDEVRV